MSMAGEQEAEEARQMAEEGRARASRAVGKLVLASIGAVALGEEAIENLLNRLVVRGEQVQEAARRRADALRERTRHLIGPRMQRVESALNVADLPSKADILSLQDQIAALSAKIDQMSEEKSERTTQA